MSTQLARVSGITPFLKRLRVDLVQRRLVAVEVDEVRVGDAVVEHVVEEQVASTGFLVVAQIDHMSFWIGPLP